MTPNHTGRRWHSAGLFLVTFATLVLEVLDTRLLSVLTWYHLSFFAVSIAMLGMAAGAVRVFLGGREFEAPHVRKTLASRALAFSVLLPLSHLVNLIIPLPQVRSLDPTAVIPMLLATAVLTAPFFISGMVVTIALTRVGGSIGNLYFYDLLGASAGCLLVVVMLNWLNITSVAFIAGAAAAAAAYCFQRFAAQERRYVSAIMSVGLLFAAVLNGIGDRGIRIRFAKNKWLPPVEQIDRAQWNSHSFVLVQRPRAASVFYWGPGAKTTPMIATLAWVFIDGEAGTAITGWDGRLDSLAWVEHDVTGAPYALRRGEAAIIGVGGGRDILSAIRSGSSRITGIEINSILLEVLRDSHREFARIANQPGVTLIHDEARSYLSRAGGRFDVLQMSLIDTWAATGAGAFTLSENGLYTVEAWRVFLNALKPGGIFSVSRWFSPDRVSETNRLLGLGVAAVLDRGIADPKQHLILISRGSVATLMTSTAPFTAADHARLDHLAREEEFRVVVSPWTMAATEQMARAVSSTTRAELDAALIDPDLDYSPPTDERPYFFNLLKLGSFMKLRSFASAGVVWGNLAATTTLVVLLFIAALLVVGIIVLPLIVAGKAARQMPAFGAGIVYFAAIGTGYMLIQMPFLQRFSVFLGHPTYTFAIVLFSMILFTGIGSFFSDKLSLDSAARRYQLLPFVISLMILAAMAFLGPVTGAMTRYGLVVRTLIVVMFTAPLSLLLGCCFPIGMRLVGRRSQEATAWMWGVNGACGVIASIAAVAISMSVGTNANLLIAAALYALLVLPMRALAVASHPL